MSYFDEPRVKIQTTSKISYTYFTDEFEVFNKGSLSKNEQSKFNQILRLLENLALEFLESTVRSTVFLSSRFCPLPVSILSLFYFFDVSRF